jgi:hypothetical protein
MSHRLSYLNTLYRKVTFVLEEQIFLTLYLPFPESTPPVTSHSLPPGSWPRLGSDLIGKTFSHQD